jgi:hypothetical protein
MNSIVPTIFIRNIFFFFLMTTISCSGNYYGVNGSDTYSREESIDIITNAQLLRLSYCSERESAENLALTTAITNPRLILDSAFYTKKDVRECEKAILLTPCPEPSPQCNLGPKEFLKGKLFQGGF